MSKFSFLSIKKFIPLIFGLSLTTSAILPIKSSLAETIPTPSNAPLELSLLTKPQGSVITANTIAPQGLTVPSFWWVQQITERKLLDNWIAYPENNNESPRVDLIVNQQIWSLLDYLERYKFVNKVGTTARNFGYNIRIFNYQEQMLATYTCHVSVNPSKCNIQMVSQSKLGFSRELDSE